MSHTQRDGSDGDPMGYPTRRPLGWDDAIRRWLSWLAAQGQTPATRVLRDYHMGRLANEMGCAYWQVTAEQLTAWMAGHRWSRETIRSHRATFRSFFGWAYDSGYTEHNPAGLLAKVKTAPPRPKPAAESVIDAARSAAAGNNRLSLSLELASRHGLRRIEISRVNLGDLFYEAGAPWLAVHGKGEKTRDVPLSDAAERLIRVTAGRRGFCFPGHFTEDGVDTGHVSPYWIGRQLKNAMGGAATGHQLRHRFATVVYDRTKDLMEVSRLLGHESTETTQRYVARNRARAAGVRQAAD